MCSSESSKYDSRYSSSKCDSAQRSSALSKTLTGKDSDPYKYQDMSQDEFIDLCNERVRKAELWQRPTGSIRNAAMPKGVQGSIAGVHQGVVITTIKGDRYLVHKLVDGTQPVVEIKTTIGLSTAWRKTDDVSVVGCGKPKPVVHDFLKACNKKTFNVLRENCQHAAKRMMNVPK